MHPHRFIYQRDLSFRDFTARLFCDHPIMTKPRSGYRTSHPGPGSAPTADRWRPPAAGPETIDRLRQSDRVSIDSERYWFEKHEQSKIDLQIYSILTLSISPQTVATVVSSLRRMSADRWLARAAEIWLICNAIDTVISITTNHIHGKASQKLYRIRRKTPLSRFPLTRLEI